MGNFEQGLVIGGTLELVWMGFISYAGIINGETRIGAILGTYFALATGNSFDVAISIAMPIAILGGNVSNAYNIVVSYLMQMCIRDRAFPFPEKIMTIFFASIIVFGPIVR